MIAQSRSASAVESCANIAIGYFLSLAVWSFVGPMYGFNGSLAEDASICAIFTIVSLVRSFTLRRAFNALTVRSHGR